MQLVNRLSASDREETGAELMRKYDKDKDGSFSIDEVAVIVSDVQKERRAKKNYKKMACLLVAIVLFVLGGNAGLTVAVVYLTQQIDTNSESGVASTPSGKIVKTGQIGVVSGPLLPVHQRRLRNAGGRRLVEILQIDQPQVLAVAQSNENTFAIKLETDPDDSGNVATLNLIGNVISQSKNSASNTMTYNVQVNQPASTSVFNILVRCVISGGDCSVLDNTPGASGRMRELTAEEEGSMRRRLSRISGAATDVASTKPRLGLSRGSVQSAPTLVGRNVTKAFDDEADEELGCVLYHCFAREPDCEEPAHDNMCTRWSANGTTCEAPLCRFMDDQLLGDANVLASHAMTRIGVRASAGAISSIPLAAFLLAHRRGLQRGSGGLC